MMRKLIKIFVLCFVLILPGLHVSGLPEIPSNNDYCDSCIVEMEYFFNVDPGFGNGISIPIAPANEIINQHLDLDISSLNYGFNHFYLRAKDGQNKWSLCSAKSFYKETVYAEIPDIISVEYFLDDDPGEGKGIEIPMSAAPQISEILFVADISELKNGFHHLNIRAMDSHGNWSLTAVKSFYNETIYPEIPDITYIEYFLDEDPGEGNGTEIPITAATNISSINLNIDISDYTKGFHRLYVRSKDANGSWSFANTISFFKESIITETQNIVRAEYFFNSDPGEGNGIALPISAAPNIQGYTFVANLTDVPSGENTIFVRAMDQNGHWSLTNTQTVNIDPHPVILLESDFWLDCAHFDFEQDQWLPFELSVTVQAANSISWSTVGDGTFDDPTSLNPKYYLGENDIISGEVILTLSAEGLDPYNITVSKNTLLHIPTQLIPISQSGWRGISSYIDNGDLSMAEVLAPVEAYLTIIKDVEGKVYNPATGINEIGNWNAVGYQANFNNPPACLSVYGAYISSKVFEMNGQLIYLPVLTDIPIAIEDLFNGHLDKIQMIYDWGTFQFWTPENAGFTMLQPGFAYSVAMVGTTDQFTIEYPPFSWEEPLSSILVSGTVSDEFGNPVENVEVQLSDQTSVYTNINGEYTASIPVNWNGAITAFKEDWSFLPESRNLGNVVVNIFDMDFEGINNACDPAWSYSQTPLFHTILIPLDANPQIFGKALEDKDWIGVFYKDDDGDDRCGGWVQWTGVSNVELTAYGDDPSTPEKDGFDDGEQIQWKIYKCDKAISYAAFATYNPFMPQSSGEFESYGFSSLLNLEGQVCQEITLSENWNDISLWLTPQNPVVEELFAPMVNDLIIVRNLNAMYWPVNNINSIGAWDNNSGYVIKTYAGQNFEICGTPLENTELSLSIEAQSWYYLPVLSTCSVDANALFSGQVSNIEIVKDLIGNNVWWPEMGIYTLTNLFPGQAYEIKISDDISLSYQDCASQKPDFKNIETNFCDSYWGKLSASPFSHTIAFPENAIADLSAGTQIGVFGDDGVLYGCSRENTQASFAIVVNGDDPTTPFVDGMTEGEQFHFRIFNLFTAREYPLEVEFDEQMPQNGYFVNHGLSAIKSIQATGISGASEVNTSVTIYPNPSNAQFNIQLKNTNEVNDWEVLDIHGNILLKGNDQFNGFSVDLASHPKGIYYLKITQEGMQIVRKLVLQ